jgi:hypothetical protein
MTNHNSANCSRRGFFLSWGRRLLLAGLAGLTCRLAGRRPVDCGQPLTLACDRCAWEVHCQVRDRRMQEIMQLDSETRTRT